jgi:hypothetical protein
LQSLPDGSNSDTPAAKKHKPLPSSSTEKPLPDMSQLETREPLPSPLSPQPPDQSQPATRDDPLFHTLVQLQSSLFDLLPLPHDDAPDFLAVQIHILHIFIERARFSKSAHKLLMRTQKRLRYVWLTCFGPGFPEAPSWLARDHDPEWEGASSSSEDS